MTPETSAKRRSVIANILPRRESQAFGAISVYPRHIKFQTQNPGEKVFVLVRAHVIVNLGWMFRFVLLGILPVGLMVLLNYFDVDLGFLQNENVVLMLMSYYVSILAYALMHFLAWYYNIYLITSERILDFDFSPLSSYRVAEAELENIQDVTQSTVGFLPNLFGYGDIVVQTASTKNKFYFRAVPRPVWFRDVIADLSRLIRADEP